MTHPLGSREGQISLGLQGLIVIVMIQYQKNNLILIIFLAFNINQKSDIDNSEVIISK
jgi:hypothetical protein